MVKKMRDKGIICLNVPLALQIPIYTAIVPSTAVTGIKIITI